MKKNHDYTWKRIEDYANENNCDIQEYGMGTIGTSFVVILHNNKDAAISFVLTGYNSVEGNLYTCIYTDL